MKITATIDDNVKVVSEASIRRHLKLEDSDGISTLPTSEIFKQLALMGNMKRASKGYTGVDTPLFQTMLVQGQILQGEGSTIPVESHHTPISAPSTSQPPTSPPSMPTTYVAEEAATMPHDSPLLIVHLIRSDEGSMTLNELTVLCTTLSKKVETLESRSSKARRRVRLVVSEDEDELEDPSKQGRKIAQIDEDEGITLVQMKDYTVETDISTANVPVSTTGEEVSTASPEVKTTAESLVYIRRSASKRKDKGKAIMKEAEPVQNKVATRARKTWDNTQAQIEADEELAHRLQAQERERYSEADKARLLHMGSHTLQQLKKLSFDDIKELFETIMKRVNTFTQMESDDTVPKVVARSSKRDDEQEINQESLKRQKIGEGSEPAEESNNELSQEQLQQLIIIVPEQGMNIEAL
ncbi:hypothetical protein Tco_1124962 [Tanacetum coccineum]|uniref:Uncharacterized protein n=1 Tax=Tanacetum coccineum TaxID=301880 RepID=A0ABQ5J7M1_9ASTR